MSDVRGNQSQIEPARQRATFDEQLWPVNVALLVLAGFVAGAIIAQSSFEGESRLFHNGWVRLVSLAVSTGLLMWGASRLSGTRFQRALQLATLVSILVHVVFIVALYQQRDRAVSHLFDPDALAALETPPEPEELVVQPEYRMEAPGESPHEEGFEKPVEALARDEQPAPIERRQPPAEMKAVPHATQPAPVPGATPDVQPSPLKMAEHQEAAPRSGRQPSKFSKRAAESRFNPENPAPATPETKITDQPTAKVEARVAAVEREANARAAGSMAKLSEPASMVRQQEAAQLARREHTESRPSETSSIPMARQPLNEPVALPRAVAAAPRAELAPASGAPPTVEPRLPLTRQQAAGPLAAEQPGKEVKVAMAPSLARLDAPRHERVDLPRLAKAPQAAPTRTATEPSLPAGAAADMAQGGAAPRLSSAPAPLDQIAPGATAIARKNADAPAAAPLAAEVSSDSPARPTMVASAQPQRAVKGAMPSLTPSAKPAAQVSRAIRSAAVEGSPVAIDSPGPVQQSGGAAPQPNAQPGRSALAKGSTGVYGNGGGPNLDSGEAAAAQPSTVASTSAVRSRKSQAGPDGPALTPSAPALVAKGIAGASLPTATLPAEDVRAPTDMRARAGGISHIEASSSAAIQRANAAAPKGPVTAGVGAGQIDIGPTQIIGKPGNAGTALGAGGGAPTVKFTAPSGQISRTSSGGAPLAALAAQNVADLPEAPPGSGGGTPAGSSVGNGPVLASTRSGGTGSLPLAPVAIEGRPGGVAGAAISGDGVGGGAGGTALAAVPVARAGGGEQEGIVGAGTSGLGGAPRVSRSLGAGFSAETKADIPQMAATGGAGPGGAAGEGAAAASTGAGSSGSGPGSLGPAAIVAGPARVASGMPGQPLGGPVGAAGGDTVVDSPIVGAPGNGINPRKVDALGDQDAPLVAAAPMVGPLHKANVAGSLQGSAEAIADAPSEGGQGTDTGPPAVQPGELALQAEAGAPGRRAGSLPVQVAALDGPGGLGVDFSPEVGSLQRRAQRDSLIVNSGSGRFLGKTAGGPLLIDGRAREPTKAFVGRGSQRKGRGGGLQPLERTEDAVELGLDFLARHQFTDGRWSLNNVGAVRPGNQSEQATFHSDTAATGLALLSFLGAGYDHYDEQYKSMVHGGLQFLLKHQQPSGDLYIPTDPVSNQSARLYSHGIATIALCEAYGMTGDESLRKPAQKAIDFIVASQHPTLGGWRYKPQVLADTSVSGWQLMAMKSGELAGLSVPPEAYRLARHWLDTAQVSPQDGSQYAYNPFAPDTVEQRHGRQVTTTMTAVGLLMRLYLGWNRDDPNMQRGAQHLLENLPNLQAKAQRDTYYWYYATQVMFHMKGEYWRQWNERLHPLLIDRQIQSGPMAGSWDPLGPVPDKWGAQAGRIYVTTMNLLSLEVYYRHLPIYESEAR